MAQLSTLPLPERWSHAQTRTQYAAIAWLRWRILINGFRRKGGGGELVARLVTVPLACLLLIGPTVAAGIGAWFFAANTMLPRESWLLWGIFAFSQAININLGQPGTTFDPVELIRFPMRLRHYVAIRLFFGLLAPANITVVVMSLAVAVGIGVAMPSLLPYALPAMLAFALTNVMFTRMVFAWVDRWMSTRRAREVFTALIFTVSLGFQYLNVRFNPAYNHHRGHHVSTQGLDTALNFYHHVQPVLNALPPGLTAGAMVTGSAGHALQAIMQMTGCVLFGVVFLLVFVLRMRTEFRGENLSDSANATKATPVSTASVVPAIVEHENVEPQRSFLGLPPVVLTIFGREFLYLRRNSGVFYSLIAPLVMVLLFAGRLASRHNPWIFPAALAYTLMGLSQLSYNTLGLEGAGVQFFFMAPVRLRDVFLAKNLMNFATAVVEGFAVLAIVTYLSAPPAVEIGIAGLLWAIGTMLFNTTVGNFRSVASPKKINPNRTSNKQTSSLSALMSVGLLVVASGFGTGLLLLAKFLELNWLLVPVMLVYAAGGLLTYLACLRSMDKYALDRREILFEELCKR